MRKYRHEIKYIISRNYAKILKKRLSLLLDRDKYSKSKEGSYLIKSLYFDDYQNTAYYEKIDGVLYRKKYRIRIYNNDDKFIRLECKYKHNNLTSKEQTLISRDIYNKIINDSNDIDTFGDKVLTNFLMDCKVKKLKPCVIVEYQRTAFTYPISTVRITFDEMVKSGLYNYDLFDKSAPTYTVLGDDLLVLEVKYDDVLPEIIEDIIKTVPMYRQSVSKFAMCRSIK